MYTRISKSGERAYLQIVESFRNEAGQPRQRVLANLLRMDHLKPGMLDPLIRGLQRVADAPVEAPVAVLPESAAEAEFQPSRALGHLYALHQLWSELGLGTALRRCFKGSRRQFDAEALIRTMVFNRLVDPRSKLGLLDWLKTVAMPECPSMTHQQLLRAMDALIEQLDEVEAAVAEQTRPLLDQSVAMMFYDLTTIRYTGESGCEDASEWPVIGYGLGKEHAHIQRQFVLGVVQSACGLPLLHTVAPGNVGESTTLAPMLEHALKRFPVKQVTVVADRGLLSLDNIQEIQALAKDSGVQIDFILALSARRYSDLNAINPTLVFEAGLAESRFAEQRLVIAHDPEREAAQTAARRKHLLAAEQLGTKLAEQLDALDEKDQSAAKSSESAKQKAEQKRRASDRSAYVRFAREMKDQKLTRFFNVDRTQALFTFERNEQAISAAEAFDGKLYLLTSLPKSEHSAQQIVERYKALADIERGFRTLKSELLIAPVHHRLERRIRAHALICFLALLLHRVLRKRLRASGSKLSSNSALELLSSIQRHQVRLHNQDFVGITRLAPEQLELFDQLKIKIPSKTTL